MIYDEKNFMSLDYKTQNEIKSNYPFMYPIPVDNDRVGMIIVRQAVMLDDLLELNDKIFITAFRADKIVLLTGYIGNVRLECYTTENILTEHGVEVK